MVESKNARQAKPETQRGTLGDTVETTPSQAMNSNEAAPSPAAVPPAATPAVRSLQEQTLLEFAEALGSSAPTPGGGGASALTGALAAALAEMVAQLTVGRAKFQAAEAAAKQVLSRAQEIRAEMLRLIDADAQAYGTVKAAYSLPKATQEQRATRDTALQRALIAAMQPPLDIMDLAAESVVLAGEIATVGNPTVASDAGCAAVLGDAAARAAALNIMANLVPLKDCPEKAEAAERIRRMRGRITALRLQALTRVFERMGLRPEVPSPEDVGGML